MTEASPMKRICLTLLLSAATPLTLATDKTWHPVEAGCHAQPVYGSLASWREAPHSLSSIRLAVAPDADRGPTITVALDRGLHRDLKANGEPVLIAAVGDRTRTCVHRMPLAACEPAEGVRDELVSLSIPLSRDFDADFSIRLHATRYHLQWRDGAGEANSLAFLDTEHPVSVAVTRAIDRLQPCWAPAMEAWRGSH
ncbi:hypothetical protein [Pseudomarimonas salicorniae]|uniref:Uncharacterized protein n=1 Tax=Pseudomarimonas salicorniae TaxID=2933270 RepID=A0ABT0GM75_9GAMM|nr:hypothetical protein [Lysobacter sp. CAU 1642]MCK7595621.1 hypothetical protein [Lysobacter sp. CAU 1642]